MSDSKKRKRNRWAFPLGLLIVVFAVIGVVSVVTFAVEKISAMTSDDEKIAEYEAFILPIIMNDPDPFDDISGANMEQLIDSSIWALMTDTLNPNEYEYYESQDVAGIIVPQEDVEVKFKYLFGSEVIPVHCDINGSSYKFTYIPAEKHYIIPLTGLMSTYAPKVYTVERKGSSTILTVGYLYESDWSRSSEAASSESEPVKFMRLTLRDSESGYYVSSLQATDAPETATTSAEKTTATQTDLPEIVTVETTAAPADETTTQGDDETTTAEDGDEETTSEDDDDEKTTSEDDDDEKTTSEDDEE